MKKQLILIRGVPGSGKTTMAKQLQKWFMDCSKTATHFEADMYFTDTFGEYRFDHSSLGQAHSWCQNSTRNALGENDVVIVSNTFVTKKELRVYFEMAKSVGIIPTIIVCSGQYKNIHGVPDDIVERKKLSFEHDLTELFEMFK